MYKNKTLFNTILSTEYYDEEVTNTLALGCVEHALLFYQVHQYFNLFGEEFLSLGKYNQLCDFLLKNITPQLSTLVPLDDLKNYTCNLAICNNNEEFKAGKHLFKNIEQIVSFIEEKMKINGKLEVVLESDSTN
jgi:hypothetical protein